MKGKTLPGNAGDEAQQSAVLLNELFDRIRNKKLMLDTSAQKDNLIKQLKRIHLTKWLSGKSNNTPEIKIFQCQLCRLWHPDDRLRSRVCLNDQTQKLEIFRVCRSCQWICRKMNIGMIYAEPKKK